MTALLCLVSSVFLSPVLTAALLTVLPVAPTSSIPAAFPLWVLKLSGNCSPPPILAVLQLLVWLRVLASTILVLPLASCPVKTSLSLSAKSVGSFPTKPPSVRMSLCSLMVSSSHRFTPLLPLPDIFRTGLSGTFPSFGRGFLLFSTF